VRDALSDDLRTPQALDAVDRWAIRSLANEGSSEGAPTLVRNLVDALLGVQLHQDQAEAAV